MQGKNEARSVSPNQEQRSNVVSSFLGGTVFNVDSDCERVCRHTVLPPTVYDYFLHKNPKSKTQHKSCDSSPLLLTLRIIQHETRRFRVRQTD